MKRNAVCLLSGGLDSSACLAWAKAQGFAVHALSFDYGQRHAVELDAARRVAAAVGVQRHVTVKMDLRVFGGSALTSDEIAVPKGRDESAMSSDIPVTYVPARNTVFLSYALAWAEVLDAADIVIGVNAIDYSGYPDCRPEFIRAFESLANLATKAGVEGRMHLHVHTPLIDLTKAGIIDLGSSLGLDLGLTHSCYDPDESGYPCGECDSCQLRKKGFEALGKKDPALRLRNPKPRN
jgi:7-cyano-7-deazaguanine synthase